ncbi:diguanylate cyclase [Aphanothece sacrum FPU1]|uniref:Diguanylate cyclase n=2 Tax=Aphanothece sacrum TaxID=1122 RepID=A0A401IKX6_APHSA|nr:diguanylate cyclase [Aphanothece sacrum FPU1]GBF83527.1 diguanylate cyclase [Aphanothece sacrum FPU3]
MEMEAPPDSLRSKQSNFDKKLQEQLKLDNKIDKAHRRFISSVNDNHGIKEKNILTLLLPIGINSDDLDQDWLNLMDSFGKNRGIIAHTSALSYKTKQQINPQDELNTVKKIVYGVSNVGGGKGVQGLIHVDQLLNNLIKLNRYIS